MPVQAIVLNPPLAVHTEDGPRKAHAMIDFGGDVQPKFLTVEPNGSIWVYRADELRVAEPHPTIKLAGLVPPDPRPPMSESELLTRIVAYMRAYREANASESRFSKVFHSLATEVNSLLAEILAGAKIDGEKYKRALTRTGVLAEALSRFRDYVSATKKHTARSSDSAAASVWAANASSWLSELDGILNPRPADDIAVTARAG